MPELTDIERQRQGARRMDRALALMTQVFFGALLLVVAFYFALLLGLVAPLF